MVQTTIRLPEKLYEKLKQEAKKRGMSLNGRRIMRAADIASLINVVKDFGVDANYLFGIEKGEG